MKALRHIALLICIESVVMCARAADVEHAKVENLLMATYLYKFPDYVEWPAAVNEIAAALITLVAAHNDSARKITVKKIRPGDPLSDCQILFIQSDNSSQLKELLSSAKDLPVLTVTASDGALNYGSIVNFIVVDEHIKFEISVYQASRSGLKISSRLLRVAQKIDTGRK